MSAFCVNSFLETVHLVLVEITAYHYMVKHFADPLVMLTIPWYVPHYNKCDITMRRFVIGASQWEQTGKLWSNCTKFYSHHRPPWLSRWGSIWDCCGRHLSSTLCQAFVFSAITRWVNHVVLAARMTNSLLAYMRIGYGYVRFMPDYLADSSVTVSCMIPCFN